MNLKRRWKFGAAFGGLLTLVGVLCVGLLTGALAWLPGCSGGGLASRYPEAPYNRSEDAAASRYPSTEGSGAYLGRSSVERSLYPAAPAAESVAVDQHMRSFSGAMPSRDEELWVIARTPRDRALDDEAPGCGSMLAWRDDGQHIPIPLEHTAVDAEIAGHIASVRVQQQYYNPFSEKIEAVYVFPLPENAAVNEFVMQIGDRRIRGIIRERQEAERIYEQARGQGHAASLLTQERPNIFTQSVANIEPGRRIDVDIRYFHTLAYDDGWHEWVFPMVVGPRFNPPRTRDPIEAVPYGSAPSSGAQAPYLAPGTRSGHDVSVSVRVNPGAEIGQIESVSHDVRVERDRYDSALVTLLDGATIPNRDFVLRYRVANDRTRPAVVTYDQGGDRWFAVTLYPAWLQDESRREPMEVVFVLDCSGSMNGAPIAQAKAALEAGLRRLRPQDSFKIIRFSDASSSFSNRPLPATPDNIARARRYARDLASGGGTMMMNGLRAALDDDGDRHRMRFVVFLTDGFIGNEAEVLSAMDDRIGRTRVFSFGVGSSTNRYLMDRMAKVGRGAVAYLPLEADAGMVMDAFFDRVTRPVMTDLELLVDGRPMRDVFPAVAPDLYSGRTVTFAGRFEGGWPRDVRVRGRVAGEWAEMEIPLDSSRCATSAALPAVVARLQIADLMEREIRNPRDDLSGRVTRIALAHGLVSPYTAYVAVDASRVTEGDYGVTVGVPVPVPAGVRYENTVQRFR